MVEKNQKKLKARKRRVMNGFNTGTRDMKLKTAYQRKKRWSADDADHFHQSIHFLERFDAHILKLHQKMKILTKMILTGSKSLNRDLQCFAGICRTCNYLYDLFVQHIFMIKMQMSC